MRDKTPSVCQLGWQLFSLSWLPMKRGGNPLSSAADRGTDRMTRTPRRTFGFKLPQDLSRCLDWDP